MLSKLPLEKCGYPTLSATRSEMEVIKIALIIMAILTGLAMISTVLMQKQIDKLYELVEVMFDAIFEEDKGE